jgi:hypothetical protein
MRCSTQGNEHVQGGHRFPVFGAASHETASARDCIGLQEASWADNGVPALRWVDAYKHGTTPPQAIHDSNNGSPVGLVGGRLLAACQHGQDYCCTSSVGLQ